MSKNSSYRRAVALSYREEGDSAPLVELKEEHLRADEVVKIAKRFGIPIIEKPAVAQALRNVPVDEAIPEKLYEAVATVLNEIAPVDRKEK
jgi:type III secretion system FlhB-like substrate exporter